MKIDIIGNGEFAYAIFYILKLNNLSSCLYFRNKKKYEETLKNQCSLIFPKLKISAQDINMIENLSCKNLTFFVANSNFIYEIDSIIKKIENIVICSKSFHNSEKLFFSEYLLSQNSNINISILSGPGFAKNIIEKKKTVFTSYSKNFNEFQEIFPLNLIKLEYFNCIKSIEFAGAIKNIIAIIFGYLSSKYNVNESLYYFSDIVEDILYISDYLKLNKEVFLKSCGIGDILLSITKESRNYNIGKLIFENLIEAKIKIELDTIEGIKSIKILKEFLLKNDINAKKLTKIFKEIAI